MKRAVAFGLAVGMAVAAVGCATARPEGPTEPKARGAWALDRGQVSEAVRVLTQQSLAHPDDVDAARLLAQAYTRKGDFARAATAWERVVAARSDDGEAWRRLGDVRYALARYAGAIKAYETAADLKAAAGATTWTRMAESWVGLKKPKNGLAIAQTALKRFPTVAALHIAEGRAYDQMGAPDKAILAYKRAASLAPKDGTAPYEMGRTLERVGFPKRAAAAYKQVVAVQPDHADALLRLGRVLIQSGESADALPYLTKAARLVPGSVAAHNNLGVAYSQVGLSAEAIAAFLVGLKVDASQPALHANLAEAYYKAGRLVDAERSLRTSLALAPKRPVTEAALRRVVLMQVVVGARCEAGKMPGAGVVGDALTARWSKEGWGALSYKSELSAVLSDREAMSLLDKAIAHCGGARGVSEH